jgi:hypothetical protein
MKKIIPILMILAGVGFLIWLLRRFGQQTGPGKPTASTGTATPWEQFFGGFKRIPMIAGVPQQKVDNTAGLITAGAGAFKDVVSGLRGIFGGSAPVVSDSGLWTPDTAAPEGVFDLFSTQADAPAGVFDSAWDSPFMSFDPDYAGWA